MVEIQCEQCGKWFEIQPGQVGKKRFCSSSCSGLWSVKHTEHAYGKRSRSGKRDDLKGLYVRSSWEANYARYLNWLVSIHEIRGWEYEADEFEFVTIKRGTRFYLPDFKIFNNDGSIEYHEVKGYMDKASKTKLGRMARFYPSTKVVLIDKDAYKAIASQVKNFIQNWE
jgi:hypothetical protein